MTQLIWMNSGQWCGRLFQTLIQSFGLSGDLNIQGIIPTMMRAHPPSRDEKKKLGRGERGNDPNLLCKSSEDGDPSTGQVA